MQMEGGFRRFNLCWLLTSRVPVDLDMSRDSSFDQFDWDHYATLVNSVVRTPSLLSTVWLFQ